MNVLQCALDAPGIVLLPIRELTPLIVYHKRNAILWKSLDDDGLSEPLVVFRMTVREWAVRSLDFKAGAVGDMPYPRGVPPYLAVKYGNQRLQWARASNWDVLPVVVCDTEAEAIAWKERWCTS